MAKDDLDYVIDVTKFKTKAAWGADPYKDVPTQVKSTFTRHALFSQWCQQHQACRSRMPCSGGSSALSASSRPRLHGEQTPTRTCPPRSSPPSPGTPSSHGAAAGDENALPRWLKSAVSKDERGTNPYKDVPTQVKSTFTRHALFSWCCCCRQGMPCLGGSNALSASSGRRLRGAQIPDRTCPGRLSPPSPGIASLAFNRCTEEQQRAADSKHPELHFGPVWLHPPLLAPAVPCWRQPLASGQTLGNEAQCAQLQQATGVPDGA